MKKIMLAVGLSSLLMGGSVAVIPTAPIIPVTVEEAPFYIGLGAGVGSLSLENGVYDGYGQYGSSIYGI